MGIENVKSCTSLWKHCLISPVNSFDESRDLSDEIFVRVLNYTPNTSNTKYGFSCLFTFLALFLIYAAIFVKNFTIRFIIGYSKV